MKSFLALAALALVLSQAAAGRLRKDNHQRDEQHSVDSHNAKAKSRVALRHESLLFTRASTKGKMHRSISATGRVHKTAYWGKMTLGSPAQEFKVIFDTGSGNLIIPGSTCSEPGCAPHHKYDNKASSTASAVQNENGESSSEITFGTGQISGGFFQDKLCMSEELCIDNARFIAAEHESTEPFQSIPFDGIMGLGFKDLSMGNGFNVIDDLVAKGALPDGQISFYLTDDQDSEVTFGGYKSEYLASDIIWAKVVRESWWQVSMDDITFDNTPKSLCKGNCQVAVDTGTSMLAGPTNLVDKLTHMLGVKSDCSNFASLPKLGFKLGSRVLNLAPDDYIDKSATDCSLSFMALDVPPPKGPVFIFGDPFLRRFVTIFDRKGGDSGPRVGFAVARHSGSDSLPAHELIADLGGGEPSSPASGVQNSNAVNLHLDAGLMGASDDSGDGDKDKDAVSTSYTPPAVFHPNDEAVTASPSVVDDYHVQKLFDREAADEMPREPAMPAQPAASPSAETSNPFEPASGSPLAKFMDDKDSHAYTPSPKAEPTNNAVKAALSDDPVAAMRRLMSGGSMLQKGKSGAHIGMVSIKLYKGPA